MLHWITQGGKRQARKERLFTRMPATVLQGTYKVKELKYCRHMSFVESDQLWISDSVISRSVMDQCLRSKTNRLDRSKEKSWIFDTCTFECYTIMRKNIFNVHVVECPIILWISLSLLSVSYSSYDRHALALCVETFVMETSPNYAEGWLFEFWLS